MENIIIRTISTESQEYQQVYQLRESILRKPIGLTLADEDLSKDKEDIILAALEKDQIIGCLMLKQQQANTMKFRQMAIAEAYQGKGIGNMLMSAAEDMCREKGYTKIELHAREIAEGFYTKLGYKKTSGLFTEVGIPHYAMGKDL